jgi:hypothetical protein
VLDNPGNWELDYTNPALGAGTRQYVEDIVGAYANDPRIVIWDLYNEPRENGAGLLITSTVNWARAMDPIQPIAPCAFGQWYNLIKDLSDIINIHEYPGTAGIRMIDGRPVIVSEWMYRAEGDQHPIQRLLPGYHAKKIGIWQWGLVNGDTQTHFPWGSPPGAPEPNIWHHDLYHRDGTAYDPNEIALYVQLSNTPPPEPPTIPSSTGLVQNGTFESTSGNGSTPDGWTKDFNSYGIYDGAAYSGAQGVHPGSSAGSGGLYQDITTVPGTTYSVTLMAQNFGGAAGTSNIRVLAGADPNRLFFGVDDQGASTSVFSAIVANELHATDVNGAWSQVAFSFTATSTATRLGVYNANMSGDTDHSINVDNVSIVPQGGGSEVVANGGFESPGGNALTPDGWTKDFNCFGTFSGAAYSGLQGVHPGGGSASGGLYQDITTVPGTTYSVTLMVQNFGGDAGSSHVRVLLGDSASVPVPIDDQGASTDAFDSAGIVANELFATNTAGTWAEVMFQFTATGTSTRLGVYNANMSGDTVHSINIDDVSVTLLEDIDDNGKVTITAKWILRTLRFFHHTGRVVR